MFWEMAKGVWDITAFVLEAGSRVMLSYSHEHITRTGYCCLAKTMEEIVCLMMT
jgi:hypothetical protein